MTRLPARNAWINRVVGRRARLRRLKPLDQVNEQLAEAMAEVAVVIGTDLYAWYVIVNYIAVAQRVLAKTPPETIRDCAIVTETSTLMG